MPNEDAKGTSLSFSIGKILDIATKPDGGVGTLFGLALPQFYMALAGVTNASGIYQLPRTSY